MQTEDVVEEIYFWNKEHGSRLHSLEGEKRKLLILYEELDNRLFIKKRKNKNVNVYVLIFWSMDAGNKLFLPPQTQKCRGLFFRKTCSWVHRLGCHSNPLGVPLSQGQQILTFYRSRCLKPTAAQQVCSDGGRRHRRPLWIFHKILLEETSDPRTKAQPRVITKLKASVLNISAGKVNAAPRLPSFAPVSRQPNQLVKEHLPLCRFLRLL